MSFVRTPSAIALVLGITLALAGCSDRAAETPSDAAPAAQAPTPAAESAAPTPAPPTTTPSADALPPELTDGSALGIFDGTLPCDDCESLKVVLALYLEPDRYELTETYVGGSGGDRTLQSEGTWTTLRGSAEDPNATIVQIAQIESGVTRSFLEVGENLEPLDAELRRVPANAAHALKRRPTPPAAP